ncbi:transglutaminase-like domain-containing protein [Chloroflexi bacterium TSY]|nr:transglutaminase-like domain-containing protein [Chloroflexi bacterium TSY]
MKNQVLDYYTKQDQFTDPGQYAALFDALPTELAALHKAINGVLIHIWKIRKNRPHLLEGRGDEVFIRKIHSLLECGLALDPQPLNVARPIAQRVIIDCRHFSLLLCSILRHRGIPARARCGFVTYLEDTFYMDHWVCEYWHVQENRWLMEDPDLQMHDVPPEQFISGARAWQICQNDESKAQLFGFDEQIRGAGIARINLVRDFAALNGFESVSGDSWGLACKEDSELTADDLALLDQAASFAAREVNFDERCVFYETSSGLRVPPVIHNFDHVSTNDWRTIEWQKVP